MLSLFIVARTFNFCSEKETVVRKTNNTESKVFFIFCYFKKLERSGETGDPKGLSTRDNVRLFAGCTSLF